MPKNEVPPANCCQICYRIRHFLDFWFCGRISLNDAPLGGRSLSSSPSLKTLKPSAPRKSPSSRVEKTVPVKRREQKAKDNFLLSCGKSGACNLPFLAHDGFA